MEISADAAVAPIAPPDLAGAAPPAEVPAVSDPALCNSPSTSGGPPKQRLSVTERQTASIAAKYADSRKEHPEEDKDDIWWEKRGGKGERLLRKEKADGDNSDNQRPATAAQNIPSIASTSSLLNPTVSSSFCEPAPQPAKKPTTVPALPASSHLLTPTAAAVNSQYKHETAKKPTEHHVHVKPIDPSSHLMTPTAASLQGKSDASPPPLPAHSGAPTTNRSEGHDAYSEVPSKLFEPTAAVLARKTEKFKKDKDTNLDEREAGWNSDFASTKPMLFGTPPPPPRKDPSARPRSPGHSTLQKGTAAFEASKRNKSHAADVPDGSPDGSAAAELSPQHPPPAASDSGPSSGEAKRRNSSGPYAHVHSKLMEPTAAAVAAQKAKVLSPAAPGFSAGGHAAIPPVENSSEPVRRHSTSEKFSNVPSKLHESTAAAVNGQWTKPVEHHHVSSKKSPRGAERSQSPKPHDKAVEVTSSSNNGDVVEPRSLTEDVVEEVAGAVKDVEVSAVNEAHVAEMVPPPVK
jgi:hypothetical protein